MGFGRWRWVSGWASVYLEEEDVGSGIKGANGVGEERVVGKVAVVEE